MPDGKNPERQRLGVRGGLQGWSGTDDRGERHQRMAHVRSNSPASDDYWLRQLGHDPEALTYEQRKELAPQVATKKKLYYAKLRSRSSAALKRRKAESLLRLAEKLDREAAEMDGGAA